MDQGGCHGDTKIWSREWKCSIFSLSAFPVAVSLMYAYVHLCVLSSNSLKMHHQGGKDFLTHLWALGPRGMKSHVQCFPQKLTSFWTRIPDLMHFQVFIACTCFYTYNKSPGEEHHSCCHSTCRWTHLVEHMHDLSAREQSLACSEWQGPSQSSSNPPDWAKELLLQQREYGKEVKQLKTEIASKWQNMTRKENMTRTSLSSNSIKHKHICITEKYS